MVQIKLLDSGPFYYHEYEKILHKRKNEFGETIKEVPSEDWLLPYQPIYIMTDEEWLINRIREYQKKAFDKIDIIPKQSDNSFFCCSIPQEMFSLCMPPTTRHVENKLPVIKGKYPIASDGNKI